MAILVDPGVYIKLSELSRFETSGFIVLIG